MALVERVRNGRMVAEWRLCQDAELLAASGSRNQQAFAELMARHYQAVYRVAWRLSAGHVDAEDVTQEAFLKLWNNPQQLRESGALKGWLMRVASNLVMDRYRQKPMQELDKAEHVVDHAATAPEAIDQAWVTRRMDAAIADLPERQKLALIYVHFEHMTNIVAAAVMDISVDALESLLARARRGLKIALANDGRQMLAVLAVEEK